MRTQTNDYQTAIRIPSTVLEHLRAISDERDVSVAQVIRWAIREYLERHEGEAA